MNKPTPQQKKSKRTTIERLVEFIENDLSNFTSSVEFSNILAIESRRGEDKHSQAFRVFMNNKAKSKFVFEGEVLQKGSAKVDIGVYKGSILIFTIEAKVLPMPEPKKIGKSRDEHEYVYRDIGSGAGIERFRKNIHGLDDSLNLLVENGMIAYIKEKDFDYWFDKINQWILDAGWCKEETLKSEDRKYLSKHTRIDGSELILHHFWSYV